MTMTSEYPAETLDTIAARIGREHGSNAASWAIDGNTSTNDAQRILDGYNDSDPAVMDMQPSPLSGEWADGLSEDDVIREIVNAADYLRPAVTLDDVSDDARDDLIRTFEDGYSEGYWDEIVRACKAVLPATVRDTLAAAGYDAETSTVVRAGTVTFSTAHRPYAETRDVLTFTIARVNAMTDDDPLYIGNYRALDDMPEWAELRTASPWSDATYFALEMDGPAPADLMDVITGLETYPAVDDEYVSQAEMDLGEEHWDSYGRHDARQALVAAVAETLDVDPGDVDLDDVFGTVDVDQLLDDRVVSHDGNGRYPEYVDPSYFEFHPADIARDVIADMRAWLTAEYNRDQLALFDTDTAG